MLVLRLFAFAFSLVLVVGLAIPDFEINSTNQVVATSAAPKPKLADSKVLSISSGRSYVSVPTADNLKPRSDKNFIVSSLIRFEAFPQKGNRHTFVSKYDGKKYPYPGWAFALHNLGTSMRPEIYWRGVSGRGGWYAFERVRLREKRWYSFSIVSRPRDYLSLYLQPFHKTSAGSLEPTGDVVFLGGYDVRRVQLEKTSSELLLGAVRTGKKAFSGYLGRFLLAAPRAIPNNIRETRELVDGGPAKLVANIKGEDLLLWIAGRGIDESPYARNLTLVGKAKWSLTP